MAALPYIQLYVADYLADTAHLTTEQHGAYLLLIMNYWQRGKPLKNSNERLANVTRMSNEAWLQCRTVLQEYFIITDEEWIHKRIEKDLEAVKIKSEKAREAGKASGERRRAKSSKSKKQSNKRSTNAERKPNHTDTDTDTDIYINSFLAAWEKYPANSKGSETKAQEKFIALVKADPTLLQKIPIAIEEQHTEFILKQRYGIWCPEWKHFITWLNQSCWKNKVNTNEEFWKNEAAQRNIKNGQSGTTKSKQKSKTDALWDECAPGAFKGTIFEGEFSKKLDR